MLEILERIVNGQGKLEAKVYVDGQEGIVNIRNTYATTGTTAYVRAEKKLTGRDLVNGEFTFLLQPADAQFNLLAGNPFTATNNADGSVTFAIPYTTAGDYYFVMTEDMTDAVGGITFDGTHYQVHIVVYDDGNGALQSVVHTHNADDHSQSGVVFNNYYQAAPVAVEVAAQKQLHGKELAADQFTFQLVEANTKELLQTVTNAADGTITFANLTFTKAGTYTYLIREHVPTPEECYHYDETQYVLTVEVIDDGSGQLQARKTVTVEGKNTPVQQILFENEYLTFLEVEIDKTVVCNRVNQYRGPEGFQFEAYLDGHLMATYTSDADGKTGFKLRGNYIVVGTYELQIREVDQGEEHMIYDDTVYTVTLKIDYDENGTLAFFINDNPDPVDKIILKFQNVYEGVPPVGPETGDHFDVLLIGGAALICLAGIAVALVLLKKKKPEEN
jgi:pilin isopeptide linkage protein